MDEQRETKRTFDKVLDVGGISGRNPGLLASALVNDTPEDRREDLRCVLVLALEILGVDI